MSGETRFAVLGLGEAGARYAAELAADGLAVAGYDPAAAATPAGVERAASVGAAVNTADVVLCLATATYAVPVAREAVPHLRRGSVYADLNTTAPLVKREVAAAVSVTGALPVDAAVLAPVPRSGLRTPLLVCGPGARPLADALQPLGVAVEVLEADVGEAAARKLLRGVFMKGLAAVVLEALAAGRAAGCEEWVRAQVRSELEGAGADLVDRLVEGSSTHARRRVHEMEAAREYLIELEAPVWTTEAALGWLTDLTTAADAS